MRNLLCKSRAKLSWPLEPAGACFFFKLTSLVFRRCLLPVSAAQAPFQGHRCSCYPLPFWLASLRAREAFVLCMHSFDWNTLSAAGGCSLQEKLDEKRAYNGWHLSFILGPDWSLRIVKGWVAKLFTIALSHKVDFRADGVSLTSEETFGLPPPPITG